MTLKPPVSSHDHQIGGADARAILVEYGDYQCPHCAAAEPTVRAVQRALGSELLFVFRNFPLTEVHPAAEAAAELAEAAGEHGKYWDAHHAIFAWSRKHGPETFGLEAFATIAESIGLASKAVLDAIESHRYLERIRNDFNGGVRSGVNGTPTFFIEGVRYDGPRDEASMKLAIEAAFRAR
jgi:protein-disulfide isomerase